MSLLVVMAHFDVARTLREHVRQALENYASAADRVIVVSTSGLSEASMAQLPQRVEFATRRNFGYDFFSYKWALDLDDEYPDYDQILIVNDSFVGPVVPLAEITNSEQAARYDMMGMTLSSRHGEHAQSFFVLVNKFVARSKRFRSFWKDMVPISERMDVIQRYEVGFSRTIADAGFSVGSYFVPSPYEERLAAARYQWHAEHRLDRRYPQRTIAETHAIDLSAKPWNPGVAYADRILLADRLPILKFDTLRYDPYSLGAAHLLAECIAAKPEYFSSVATYLLDTEPGYPVRPGEVNKPTTHEALQAAQIGYVLDPAFDAEP